LVPDTEKVTLEGGLTMCCPVAGPLFHAKRSAPVARRVVVSPAQIRVLPLTESEGVGVTITITICDALQPLPEEPVTTNEVVTRGETTTCAEVPTPGQKYICAPLAVSVALSPEQILVLPETESAGPARTAYDPPEAKLQLLTAVTYE
jgi:hypothetical protein